MKLLFENWRKYLNETIEPALDKNQIEYIISDKFSFNSAQSSQHRWGYRQPIIDYYFDERIGAWKYKAAIPDGTDKVDKWPKLPADGRWSDENIEEFLTRVKEDFSQMSLFKKEKEWGEGIHFTDKAKQIEQDPDGIVAPISRVEIAKLLNVDLDKIEKKKGWDPYPRTADSKEVDIIDGWALFHAVQRRVKELGYPVEDIFKLVAKLQSEGVR